MAPTTAVERWLPAAVNLANAVRDTLAVDRLILCGKFPPWAAPVLDRLAKNSRRRATRAAKVARRLRIQAFGEPVG